ncbi:ankyrin repeat-containing domain protein [Aspergillus californicus]
MSLLELPIELVYQILGWLEYASELSAFSRTDKLFHAVGNPVLYQHNVQHGESSALAWACEHGCLTTVDMILDAGASPHETHDAKNIYSPVVVAIMYGHEAIVRRLAQRGVDLRDEAAWMNRRHRYYYDSTLGNNPFKRMDGLLLLAARHGRKSLVRFLLDFLPRRNDVDSPISLSGEALGEAAQMTILALAAENGHHHIVHFLLERGVDPTHGDQPYNTPIRLASRSGNIECVELLLDAGIMDNLAQQTRDGAVFSPLTLAASWGDYLNLIAEPADKAFLCCVAAASGKADLVRDLLEKYGYRTSRIPLVLGDKDMVLRLLTYGSDPFPTPSPHAIRVSKKCNITPLIEAVQCGDKEIVNLLLNAGADPNHYQGYAMVAGPALQEAIPFESH